MITMTTQTLEKIDLLDKLFGALSPEQLKELTETEQVVAILKGTNESPGLLRKLLNDFESQAVELQVLRNDVLMLKNDVREIIRAMNTLYNQPQPYSSELTSLKSRHSVY